MTRRSRIAWSLAAAVWLLATAAAGGLVWVVRGARRRHGAEGNLPSCRDLVQRMAAIRDVLRIESLIREHRRVFSPEDLAAVQRLRAIVEEDHARS